MGSETNSGAGKAFSPEYEILINFRNGIQERFKQTDQALEDVPTWPNVRTRDRQN